MPYVRAGVTSDPDRPDDLPEWWAENQRIREELNLPPYRPPRFEDGTYTHEVTSRLEEEYDCSIRFASVNPRYPEDWSIEVDGRAVASIGRHRDENGNTVYETTTSEFEELFEKAMRKRSGD